MKLFSKPLNVLLADDDDNDVLLIRRALMRLTKLDQFRTVSDGEQVIAYFRGAESFADRRTFPIPDLLILDHRMPRISGLDVLFWLRTQKPFERLPTLLFTTALAPAQLKILRSLRAVFCVKTGMFPDLLQVLHAGIESVFDPTLGQGSALANWVDPQPATLVARPLS